MKRTKPRPKPKIRTKAKAKTKLSSFFKSEDGIIHAIGHLTIEDTRWTKCEVARRTIDYPSDSLRFCQGPVSCLYCLSSADNKIAR
jgi:hypothetical protein